jgi:hypothetical protein
MQPALSKEKPGSDSTQNNPRPAHMLPAHAKDLHPKSLNT